MSTKILNFTSSEVQVLSATATSGYVTFATEAGKKARSIRAVNIGSVGVWLLSVTLSSTACKNIAGGVAGTTAQYIAPGEDIVFEKGVYAPYVAGITDSGTATVIIHSGKGS